MAAGSIVVLDYGMGNIHSILKALRLYHADVEYTADPAKIERSRALVLPGDGAFEAAMHGLAPTRELIARHVENGRPLLGVCIGFQVLFTDSNELHDRTGIVQGLGLIPGEIRRFRFADAQVRVPHMGWNRLQPVSPDAPAYLKSYMYFIHSYRAQNVPPAHIIAHCDYEGDRFAAMVQKDSIVGCQFHPEKSGEHGLALIQDWVEGI